MKRSMDGETSSFQKKSRSSSSSDGSSSTNGVSILRNEAEYLVQSNLLRLQSEELVNEVKGSASSPSIERCIEKIKACLLASSSSSSSSSLSWFPKEEINSSWLRSKGIKGLEFTNYGDVEQTLSYMRPDAITVVGI